MSSVTALRNLVFTKLYNRRFLRNSGLLMLANLIVTGLAVIRTPAMTWLLPKDEVGMIGAVSAWLAFIQLLSLPGMDTASYHYLAKQQYWAFATNLAHRLRWSLLSTGALLLGAWYWTAQGNTNLATMFVIAGISFPVTIGLTAAGGVLGALERFTALFWYRLGESITDFAGFLPLLLLAPLAYPAALFYGFNQLATAVMMVSVSWWLWRQLRTQALAPTPEEAQTMVRYGQHLTLISALTVAQSQIDSLLVSAFLPLSVMADYAIATIISNQFKTLWSVYLSVRYPIFVRMEAHRRRQRMLWEGVLVWLGFAGAGVLLVLVAYWLIPLLLPTSYASSLPYIGWLILAFLALLPGAFVEVYFRTEQNQRQQYILRGAAAVAGLLLPAGLLSTWGATGVAAGRVLAGVVFSIVGLWSFWRDHRVTDPQL